MTGVDLQSAHVAMPATTHRHGDLIPGTKEVVHEFCGGKHDDGRSLAVRVRVAGPLVDDEGAGSQGGGNRVRVVGQVLGVVHEGAKRVVAPPRGARLGILERLVLSAHRVVPVGAQTLDTRAHGHGQSDTLV